MRHNQLALSVVLAPIMVAVMILIAFSLLVMIAVELTAEVFSGLNERLFAFVDWYNERVE